MIRHLLRVILTLLLLGHWNLCQAPVRSQESCRPVDVQFSSQALQSMKPSCPNHNVDTSIEIDVGVNQQQDSETSTKAYAALPSALATIPGPLQTYTIDTEIQNEVKKAKGNDTCTYAVSCSGGCHSGVSMV
jgi:hypothetical protein